MQESAKSDPGRCYAVYAETGDVVIVPPGWAHATISADPQSPLTFGAWCDRNYGFEYDDVRSHGGLAWFPLLNMKNEIEWIPNNSYLASNIISKSPRKYDEFQIQRDKPIYSQFEEENDKFLFVPRPDLYADKWVDFEP
jgi:glucose-6-phosphate isomerase